MVVVAAVGLVLGVEDAKPYALLLGVGLFYYFLSAVC